VDDIGKAKTSVMARRIHSINPGCKVYEHPVLFMPETSSQFDFSLYDYVVDAIDTVTGKLCIVECAQKAGVPVISSMGTGNKLDPTAFKIADIYHTSVCPLARVMRYESKKRGFAPYKVLYSEEKPLTPLFQPDEETAKKTVPGSVSFVPPVAGLIIAGEVIKELTGNIRQKL
jgi:tRNA A37 threonylcarbamoyladenosine dehydratase